MSDDVRSQVPSDAHATVLDASVIAELRSLADSAGEGFLAELASLFLTDACGRIRDLHDAVDVGDAPGVFGAAHTLAGSSSNLGANSLAELCAGLADVCRSGELSGARSRLELIDREFARVEPAIRGLIDPP